MGYIIIVLVIIIVFQGLHLFFIKKELKDITKSIDKVKSDKSNNLIHNNYGIKESNDLINKINELLLEIKDTEITYFNKNKNLTKMITNISHDLRTPLTSALGYIDIILNNNINEEEKKHGLMIVERKIKKLEELINSFFEFSKIVSSNEPPKLEKINVISILENSIATFYEDFISLKRKINYNIPNSKIMILSNQKMLVRIFDNIIINALKHSTSDFNITIKEAKNIKIIFENELETSDLDTNLMFQEFYTNDISRTKGNTGLGLAIVKEFTEKLEGSVYAKKSCNHLQIILELKKQ